MPRASIGRARSPSKPHPALGVWRTCVRLRSHPRTLGRRPMLGDDPKGTVQAMLQPWYASVSDPAKAQAAVLQQLLEGYAQTGYGDQHEVGKVHSLEDYRRLVPIASYEDFKPIIERVTPGEG